MQQSISPEYIDSIHENSHVLFELLTKVNYWDDDIQNIRKIERAGVNLHFIANNNMLDIDAGLTPQDKSIIINILSDRFNTIMNGLDTNIQIGNIHTFLRSLSVSSPQTQEVFKDLIARYVTNGRNHNHIAPCIDYINSSAVNSQYNSIDNLSQSNNNWDLASIEQIIDIFSQYIRRGANLQNTVNPSTLMPLLDSHNINNYRNKVIRDSLVSVSHFRSQNLVDFSGALQSLNGRVKLIWYHTINDAIQEGKEDVIRMIERYVETLDSDPTIANNQDSLTLLVELQEPIIRQLPHLEMSIRRILSNNNIVLRQAIAQNQTTEPVPNTTVQAPDTTEQQPRDQDQTTEPVPNTRSRVVFIPGNSDNVSSNIQLRYINDAEFRPIESNYKNVLLNVGTKPHNALNELRAARIKFESQIRGVNVFTHEQYQSITEVQKLHKDVKSTIAKEKRRLLNRIHPDSPSSIKSYLDFLSQEDKKDSSTALKIDSNKCKLQKALAYSHAHKSMMSGIGNTLMQSVSRRVSDLSSSFADSNSQYNYVSSGSDEAKQTGFWVSGNMGRATKKDLYRLDFYGFNAGVDTHLNENIVLGASYSRIVSNYDYFDPKDKDIVKINIWSIYTALIKGNSTVEGCMFYGKGSIDDEYRTTLVGTSLKVSYNVALDNILLSPHAGFNVSRHKVYDDKNTIESFDTSSVSLGLKLTSEISKPTSNLKATPYIDITADYGFSKDSNDALQYDINGNAIKSDIKGLGCTAEVGFKTQSNDRIETVVSYAFGFRNKYRSQQGSIKLRLSI